MEHDSLPRQRAQLGQFLAMRCCCGVLGFDSISARCLVCRDRRQLFALLLGLLWVARALKGGWP